MALSWIRFPLLRNNLLSTLPEGRVFLFLGGSFGLAVATLSR